MEVFAAAARKIQFVQLFIREGREISGYEGVIGKINAMKIRIVIFEKKVPFQIETLRYSRLAKLSLSFKY